MNVVRRSDGLLPRDAFVRAIDAVRSGVGDRHALTETVRLAESAAWNRTHNTIETLHEIGAITVDEAGRFNSAIQEGDMVSSIRELLVTHYLHLLDGVVAANIFQLDHDGHGLRVSAAQLPGRPYCYPYMLLEFGVLERGAIDDPFWRVSDHAAQRFMAWLGQRNATAPDRLFSLADLKAAQEAREAAGRRAEDWTVSWERRRLNGHPFVDSVRSISDSNAAAGFDILSFDGPRVLAHDRFIEVKGYADEQSFFWSEGEMEAARTLRMRYWLYLVDRGEISSPAYEPEMIQDPVGYFLDRDPIGWSVTAQGMKFTRVVA